MSREVRCSIFPQWQTSTSILIPYPLNSMLYWGGRPCVFFMLCWIALWILLEFEVQQMYHHLIPRMTERKGELSLLTHLVRSRPVLMLALELVSSVYPVRCTPSWNFTCWWSCVCSSSVQFEGLESCHVPWLSVDLAEIRTTWCGPAQPTLDRFRQGTKLVPVKLC